MLPKEEMAYLTIHIRRIVAISVPKSNEETVSKSNEEIVPKNNDETVSKSNEWKGTKNPKLNKQDCYCDNRQNLSDEIDKVSYDFNKIRLGFFISKN